MQQQDPPPAPPPVPPAPAGSQNPYSFLFEEKKKPKRPILPRGDSKKQRVIFVLVGVIIFLIIATIVMSILGRAGNASITNLQSVATHQTEIIRVAEIGVKQAKDSKTSNLALTTQLSLESSRADVIEILKKAGKKMSAKDLGTRKNTDTDTLLTNAEQANSFDTVFTGELTKQLKAYQEELQKAFNTSGTKSTQATLQKAYNNVDSLIGTVN